MLQSSKVECWWSGRYCNPQKRNAGGAGDCNGDRLWRWRDSRERSWRWAMDVGCGRGSEILDGSNHDNKPPTSTMVLQEAGHTIIIHHRGRIYSSEPGSEGCGMGATAAEGVGFSYGHTKPIHGQRSSTQAHPEPQLPSSNTAQPPISLCPAGSPRGEPKINRHQWERSASGLPEQNHTYDHNQCLEDGNWNWNEVEDINQTHIRKQHLEDENRDSDWTDELVDMSWLDEFVW